MIIVYGPYARSDDRKHVVLYDTDTRKKTTKSYAKHLLEQKLGRELVGDETADHIDGDCSNDSIDNLQVLSRGDNVKKSAISKELVDCECPNCGAEFQRDARDVRGNQLKQGKEGPFCSRSCAAKYTFVDHWHS